MKKREGSSAKNRKTATWRMNKLKLTLIQALKHTEHVTLAPFFPNGFKIEREKER